MACNESVCRTCSFHEFNNATIRICPLCGDKVLNFTDEQESPRGDDHDEIDITE